MKVIKALLAFLMGLLVIFSGVVLVCMVNPDASKTIAGLLYPGQSQTADAEIPADPFAETISSQPLQDEAVKTASKDMVSPDDGIGKDIVSDYTAPDEADLVIPEEVSEKNGYQQIHEVQEHVGEEEEQRIQSQPDYGNTGDGLDFSPVYYPYYAMLDDAGKHVYRQIYANANEIYQKFSPVEDVKSGTLRNIFSAVYNDHPELFWLDTAYTGRFARSGRCMEIELKFNRTVRDFGNAKADFEEKAEQILSGARALPDHYAQERFVHDALIDTIAYNLRAEMNQSAYSALVNGQTVCAGYARAFQYLLNELGIPCYYCTGYAGENHAWNIVLLDDGYYNVDTTWDDTGDGTYDYFNKTDEDYAGDHIRKELSVYLPPCSGQEFRNLESGERRLRSLADVGISEDQVIKNIQDYYENCRSQIVNQGVGTYTFYNVLEGKALLDIWDYCYQSDSYKRAYMEDTMIEIDANSCNMGLSVEELQGGRYLITHEVSVR